MSQQAWGLHWFRRDLRICGNEALRMNWKKTGGRTLGIFCFDSKFLARPDFSHNRFSFFLRTLHALKQDLQAQGGDLLVVDALAKDAFEKIVKHCQSLGISAPAVVTWNRDYEPFARQRDQVIENLFKSFDIPVLTCRDHLVFEPHEISKDGKKDSFYQVYSPYSRKWLEALQTEEGQRRIESQSNLIGYILKENHRSDLFKMSWAELKVDSLYKDALQTFLDETEKQRTVELPEAGFYAAFKALEKFKDNLSVYKEARDFPSDEMTSRLSIYFKNGSLTVAQVINYLNLHKIKFFKEDGPSQFLRELIWREFYYAILYFRPDVEQQSFLEQFRNIKWENNSEWFNSWKSGMTGFPIVDAGMRELAQTGWMHNRVRMIVASFLTKDLLVTWQWGELHFMKELLDGDIAPNNGGWQWAASTGCDPQPYFRVFNPWLQSEKFDKEGDYIRKYVPELKDCPAKQLHDPSADRTIYGYPEPIVNHSVQRQLAIDLYKI